MNKDQKNFLLIVFGVIGLFGSGVIIWLTLGELALKIYNVTILSIVCVILFSFLIWYGYKLLGEEDPFAL